MMHLFVVLLLWITIYIYNCTGIQSKPELTSQFRIQCFFYPSNSTEIFKTITFDNCYGRLVLTTANFNHIKMQVK